MSKTTRKQKNQSMHSKDSKNRFQEHQSKNNPDKGKTISAKPFLVLALMIAVIILVLATQWPSLTAKVISFDDDQYLVYNSLVQHPGLTSATRFLTEVLRPSTVHGYYQPLSMISLMLDYASGGRANNLLPFHRTSLLLHLLNTLFIILIIYLLFGNIWVAAIVGLFFGIHPMTIEPIPWVGERKTLLSTFFALSGILSYIFYTKKTKKSFLWLSFAMYLLALLAKPTIIALPVLLLLLDYWPLDRLSLSWRKQKWPIISEKVPFFILGAVFAVITYLSQKFTALVINPGEGNPIVKIPLIICHNIVFYLSKFLWPINLTSHYPIPNPMSLNNPAILTGVIGTIILLAVLVISVRQTKACATGWLFFFVAILPTMGIIGFTNVIASDKYAYFPMLGFLLIVAWILNIIINKIATVKLRKFYICTGGFALAIIFLMEIIATGAYLDKWQDSEVFSSYMVNLAPNEAGLHSLLGTTLANNNKLDEAIAQYQKAIQLDPENAQYYNNLGTAYCRKQNFTEAIPQLKRALQLDPNDTTAFTNLGDALYYSNKLDEAVRVIQEALRIKPGDESLLIKLGIILCKQGKSKEGLVYFDRAIRLNPDNDMTYYYIGTTMLSLQKWDEAIKMFQKALSINPSYAEAQSGLDYCMEKLGKNRGM